ncbi:CHAT domain-containing protein [Streptomyces sp. DSM 44915]|uniref:CHAT domain-containing protein n=1 Tax=Streptomyces chisholmiae TaxID=3075540 RepID=A0ABU2JRC2_9ACTN|nr:CHAT domain-containing protein [Streptomyces sp. DSM 44915]MDT0267472.1 CHAT domain-containing protein [Streptomyces sp. DSM 44915]
MRIADTLARTDRMLRTFITGEPDHERKDRQLLDLTIQELAAAARQLSPGDPLAATVRARLGSLYGIRYILKWRFDIDDGQARDRGRALRMLRAARRTDGASRLGDEDRVRTAWLLAMLLMRLPKAPVDGAELRPDDLLGQARGLGLGVGDPRIRAVFGELATLLPDMSAPDLSDQLAATLRELTWGVSTMRSVYAAETTRDLADAAERATSTAPAEPGSERLVTALDSMRVLLAGMPEEPVSWAPAAEPVDEAAQDRDAALGTLLVESLSPGFAGAERLREAVELLSAARADGGDPGFELLVGALGAARLALRTGDGAELTLAVESLRAAAEHRPEVAAALSGVLPLLSFLHSGSLQDQEEALRRLSEAAPTPLTGPERFGEDGELAVEGEQYGMLRAGMLILRLKGVTGDGDDAEDAALFAETIAELRVIAETIGPDSPLYGMALGQLAAGYLERAWRFGDRRDVGLALDTLQLALSRENLPRGVRKQLARRLPAVLALGSTLERNVDRLLGLAETVRGYLAEESTVLPDDRGAVRLGLAEVFHGSYRWGRLRAHLDAAIAEIELAGEELAEGGDRELTANLAWRQAGFHAERVRLDAQVAISAGLASLHQVAEDVLTQVGAEHGLQAARSGASRGLSIASWAVDAGRIGEAVAALEAGRALVLRAAAASVGVAERLAALGHRELAEEWRRAEPALRRERPTGPAALLADLGPERAMPGTLRRRALAALGEEVARLLATPGVPELSAAVAAAEVDALVYLLPGAAVVLGRTPGGARVLRLPGLDGVTEGPVREYLAAAARRSARPGEPAEEAAWEAALEELCGWAGRAVVGPLLDWIEGEREPGRAAAAGPPRVVLVSCGDLGVVPWHAARLPAGGYAVRRAVFSYAASGAQFRAAAERERVPPAERPVLVADPTLSLLWAVDEVATLRRAYYAGAALYGDVVDEPFPVAGAGTPEELLAVLPGGPPGRLASLLHIASHGSAGARPTVSALDLTGPLTVARLLDRPGGGPGAGERGPLVVLSACETDLSTRDHDEALTLTTAFVARGASDVVGTRWTAQDSASALLMTVFHHQLTAGGLAPPDALRAAQLWMLDPARVPPPGMSGHLRAEAGRPDLGRVRCWAPFIHQGNPRP